MQHRSTSPVAAPRLPRGVWELPYLSPDGARVVAAIDSHGRVVQQYRITAASDEHVVHAILQRELDRVDPRPPTLHIV